MILRQNFESKFMNCLEHLSVSRTSPSVHRTPTSSILNSFSLISSSNSQLIIPFILSPTTQHDKGDDQIIIPNRRYSGRQRSSNLPTPIVVANPIGLPITALLFRLSNGNLNTCFRDSSITKPVVRALIVVTFQFSFFDQLQVSNCPLCCSVDLDLVPFFRVDFFHFLFHGGRMHALESYSSHHCVCMCAYIYFYVQYSH